jgi:xylan 1,4-beta-xylosidase
VSFDLDSSTDHTKDYSTIKKIMAEMIKINSENSLNTPIRIHSLALALYYELITNFKSVNKKEFTEKQVSRFDEIITYLKQNYRQNISLNSLAEHFSFSPAYLSRLFDKTIGMTFTNYLSEQRFYHAETLLASSSLSMDEIASQSGFLNTRSFVEMHKKLYKELPSETRKKNSSPNDFSRQDNSSFYQDFEKSSYLAKLFETLDPEDSSSSSFLSHVGNTTQSLEIDSSLNQGELRHTFKTFCAVGRAADILKSDIQEMLKEMQKEIGYRYIKFHGLFDDALSVYSINYKGKEIFNFSNIDKIFDFLLSIGLKPLVQLSFMPEALAKYKDKTIFHVPLVTSEPASLDKWVELVSRLTKHLLERYGRREVESWLFSLWNEPETNTKMFGFYDSASFVKFYTATFDAVKAIDSDIRFGSPSVLSTSLTRTNFINDFLRSISPRVPDFIHLHYYPMATTGEIFKNAIEGNEIHMDLDPDAMKKEVDRIKEKQEELTAITGVQIPVYITEWNSTTSHRSIVNDLAYKGAYVVKNLIDVYDQIDSYGYWSMSDTINEVPEYQELFHGGHGLFTRNGIKKPSYYGMQFLAKLKDQLVYKGDQFICTKDASGNFVSVMSNYIHTNDLFGEGQLSTLTNDRRYDAFQAETPKDLFVQFTDVPQGTYLIEEEYVNKTHGSAFDQWMKMTNGIEPPDAECEKMLKLECHPSYRLHKITVGPDGKANYAVTLQPHEIRALSMKKIEG